MTRLLGTKRSARKITATALGPLLSLTLVMPAPAQPSTPAESSAQPVPFTVPLMRQPPTIDGLVEPDEWAAADGFDGFVGADKVGVSTGLVVTENGQGQVRGYVGATDDAIHVAVVSRIPDGTPLKATFKQDTWEAVGDDSIEVFVNPTPEKEQRVDYHRLFNSLGFGAYLVHEIGSADQTPPWLKPATWRGDWPMKQAVHDGWWHAEVTIPLASMPGVAPGRKATDGAWGVNLCRTWQKTPMTWSSLFGGYAKNTRSFRFTQAPTPAVQVSSDGLAGDPPVTFVMRVFNPSASPLEVKAALSLRQSTRPESASTDTFTLAAGEARELRIKADDLATTSVRLDAVVASPDGTVAWYDRATRWIPDTQPLPVVDLSEETRRHVVIAPGTKDVYQGHPTTLLLPDGKTMFCVWTNGHGGPCGPLKRSDDGGLTWSDLLPVPDNWKTTRNCPVLHRLTDPEGVTRLFVFAGQGPGGTRQPDSGTMQRSYSLDDGKTWSPMEDIGLECVMPFTSIVPVEGGKKLIGLSNIRRPGDTKDPWSNILVQSESIDGGLTWSPWRVLADLGRQKIGEPEVIRSPNGKQLLCLIRENVRTEPSHFITSNDEGKTWSAVQDLPPGLHGDRHQHIYLPDGRLVIAFRDMGRGSPTHDHFVAWVGRYENIFSGRDGDYKIKLLHSHKGSDCGYPGLERLPDGTIVATTYVKYRPGPEQNSLVSVRFTIAETDAAAKKLAAGR